ncbi:MAG: DMT family transporter [Desulfobacterales bacterium]|nr:MAG: DMT family transporter [Desulfobacterales bacterium]
MNAITPLIIIAAIGGTAITLQGQFMGLMDKAIGTKESVFITYAGGGLLAGVLMLAARGGNLKAWHSVPWYTLGAGAIGLVIVGTIGYTVPRLGLTRAFTVIVAAQLIVAALLDHFGLLGAATRSLDLSRLLGIGILVLGVWLTTR